MAGGEVWEQSNVVPNAPALIKSLGDAAEYVSALEGSRWISEWQRRRPEVERAFRRAIGLEVLPDVRRSMRESRRVTTWAITPSKTSFSRAVQDSW